MKVVSKLDVWLASISVIPVATICFATSVHAQSFTLDPVDWTTTTLNTASGTTSGGEAFTGTNFNASNSSFGSPGILTQDFTGSDFAGFELSTATESIRYAVRDDWSFTISPAGNTLLYARFWRPASYTFSQDFNIVAGLTGATTTGSNVLTLSSGFSNGVLDFGSISSLSVDSSAPNTSFSAQSLTLATANAAPEPVAVPEPANIWGTMAALGGISFALYRRRRQKQDIIA